MSSNQKDVSKQNLNAEQSKASEKEDSKYLVINSVMGKPPRKMREGINYFSNFGYKLKTPQHE